MSQSISVPPVSANGTGLFNWVCTKNPFYAISAALVLWGLWVSFGKQDDAIETWLLMACLTSYTLLLAVTAFGLVRYLQVWDDARTVLLLIVLLFLATSVTFDHVLVVDPLRGASCYLLGLVLAVAISEAVLRGIRLRLPLLYRLPYYLLLAVFFLYPLFVRYLLVPEYPVREPVLWGLFGFSTTAGLAFLTLLPAVRRGAGYVRDNGTPWPWPLYPWSLFVILAMAVPARAVFMCWSLHSLEPGNFADRLAFGPYFLVPFGFSLAVLLIEMGLVYSRQGLLRFVMFVPVLLIGLAMLGQTPADPIYRGLRVVTVSFSDFRAFDVVRREPDPVHAEFLKMFSERLGGDPLFVTLLLAAFFYVYAVARRVPLAVEGLSAAVAAKAVIATNSLTTGWLTPPEVWPLAAAGALQLGLGISRRNLRNNLFGTACLAAAAALAIPLPEMTLTGLRSGIFIHLGVLGMLVLGAVHSNAGAGTVRRLAATVLLLLSLAVMYEWARLPENLLPWAQIGYPLAIGILLGVYGQFLHDSFALVVATLILGLWVFKFGWAAYRAARKLLPGLDYIVPGLAFFAIGVLVSLGKAGVLRRWIESRWTLPPWLQPGATVQPATAAVGEIAISPTFLPPDEQSPANPVPGTDPPTPETGSPGA